MSTFSDEIANFFHTTEAHVISILGDILTGAEVAASDIKKGLGWVAANAPAIAASVQQVEQLVSTVAAVTPGVSQVAAVNEAIQEANKAVTALNAFATASNTGKNDAQALVQGYVAYQQAAAASATAKAAVVSAPTS